MNDKIEKFIRYFDGQMSIEQKELFENELSLDPALKEEYSNFELKFEKLKKEVQIDETYFNNIIYNSFNNSQKKFIPLALKAALALPVLLIIFFLILPNERDDNTSLTHDVSALISEFSDNIILRTDLFKDEFNYTMYNLDEILLSDIFDEETVMDESLFDYLNDNIRESDINYNFLDKISSAEFEVVFNEMVQKNIIGEK